MTEKHRLLKEYYQIVSFLFRDDNNGKRLDSYYLLQAQQLKTKIKCVKK